MKVAHLDQIITRKVGVDAAGAPIRARRETRSLRVCILSKNSIAGPPGTNANYTAPFFNFTAAPLEKNKHFYAGKTFRTSI